MLDSLNAIKSLNIHDSIKLEKGIQFVQSTFPQCQLDESEMALHKLKDEFNLSELQQIQLYFEMSQGAMFCNSFDTAIIFNYKALRISEAIHDTLQIVKAYKNAAYHHLDNYDIVSSQLCMDTCLRVIKDHDTISEEWAEYHWACGAIQSSRDNQYEAIVHYRKAADLHEALGNEHRLAGIYHNIGNIYSNSESFEEAKQYYLKALEWNPKSGNEIWLSNHHHSLSTVLSVLGEYDTAMFHLSASRVILEKLNYKYRWMVTFEAEALIYLRMYEDTSWSIRTPKPNEINDIPFRREQALDSAYHYFEYARELYQTIDEERGVYVLLSLGKVSRLMGDLERSENYLQQYVDSKKTREGYRTKVQMHDLLADLFYDRGIEALDAGRTSESAEYFQKSKNHLEFKHAYDDSILSDEETRKIAQHEKSVELEKKRKEFELETVLANERHENEKSVFKIITVGVVIILLLVLVGAIWIFSRYRVANRQKKIIEKQKVHLDQWREDITSSIEYAKRIQDSILPSKLSESLPNSTIFFKPMSIVSGDFYWFFRGDNFKLICIADSTGHGVPGAFMSMLGSTLLDRIVGQMNIHDPGKILQELSIQVNSKLGGGGSYDFTDGMDLVLLKLNDDGTNEFSGAKNKLHIVRNGEIQSHKGGLFSIGHLKKTFSYSTENIELLDGDILFASTDGLIDQPGGPQERRIYRDELHQFIINCANISILERHAYLEQYYEKWKGEDEQVDDVCVFMMTYTKTP